MAKTLPPDRNHQPVTIADAAHGLAAATGRFIVDLFRLAVGLLILWVIAHVVGVIS